MKKIMMAATLLIAMLAAVPMSAQNKEKLDWPNGKMPKLTKNATINTYLLSCDTIINNLKALDEMVWYDVKKVQVKGDDGTVTETYHIVDQNGNLRNTNGAWMQNIDITSKLVILPLTAANITLLTPGYTTELPNLGMDALKYGKYAKMGPKLAARCTKEVPEIIKKLAAQRKAIRALKQKFNDQGKLSDPSMDLSNVDGVDFTEFETVEKTNAEMEAELKKIKLEDPGDVNMDDLEI